MPSMRDLIQKQGIANFSKANEFVQRELEALLEEDLLELGDDKDLTGRALELRVRRLLKASGFTIDDGRPSKEDFVVEPPVGAAHQDRLVLEVKSSRKTHLLLEDLRQLDDWVYDLSGEKDARMRGLGGGPDILALATKGQMTETHRHPTPHKGVLIFNGQVGIPYLDRANSCISPDLIRFCESRYFCVITLTRLVSLMSKGLNAAWQALSVTVGEFSDDS